MCVGGFTGTATLAGASAVLRTQRSVNYKGGPHSPPQLNHKTPTGGEDSVDNQAECLAQSDKHDRVMLPVCGNVNIAGEELGGGGSGGDGGAGK